MSHKTTLNRLLTGKCLNTRPLEETRAGVAAVIFVFVDVFAGPLAGIPTNNRNVRGHLAAHERVGLSLSVVDDFGVDTRTHTLFDSHSWGWS